MPEHQVDEIVEHRRVKRFGREIEDHRLEAIDVAQGHDDAVVDEVGIEAHLAAQPGGNVDDVVRRGAADGRIGFAAELDVGGIEHALDFGGAAHRDANRRRRAVP